MELRYYMPYFELCKHLTYVMHILDIRKIENFLVANLIIPNTDNVNCNFCKEVEMNDVLVGYNINNGKLRYQIYKEECSNRELFKTFMKITNMK